MSKGGYVNISFRTDVDFEARALEALKSLKRGYLKSYVLELLRDHLGTDVPPEKMAELMTASVEARAIVRNLSDTEQVDVQSIENRKALRYAGSDLLS